MFSSMVVDQRLFDEYSGEEMKYSFRSPCLAIRDVDEEECFPIKGLLSFRSIEFEPTIVPVDR